MKKSSKTNQELIAEISVLKQRIQELEQTLSERIREENERRARQLTVLHETSVELTVELNLDALLHSIAQRALNLIGGAACNCYLYNPQTDLMERVVSAGNALVPSPKTRQRGEGMVGQVWVKGTPLLVNDYASWSGRTRAYDSFPSRALVAVPFRLGTEILGVLNIMAPLPHQYTQMDVEMLSLFATQAVIAIRNVRIHDRMKMELADRKRAEEALESERTLLRNLIDNVPDRIYAKDSEGRFIICNEAMIRRMGMTSMTELVGKSDFDFLPLEMAQRFRADEQAIIQSGKSMINREEPLVTEGGTITRWNLASKVPLLDKQGNRIGIVGVGREITDRKRAEEALKERNKELNCLYGISAILELPGISLDEILKRTVMLIPPAWQFPEITEASIVLEGKIFQTARFRETSWMQTGEVIVNGMPAGQVEVCYLEERQASDEGPFHKEERKLLNAIAERLGRITERKRAEEALGKSEDRYRTLVENASDIVYKTDENGYFTFVNPAALRISGYKTEEIIGKHFKLLVRPDMYKEAIIFFANQLINKICNTYYEYPIITKDGHELWIGQNMQLIMEKDRVTGFQAVARDISERRQAGKALIDSEKRYRELSIVDELTQLYNSRHFYFQLKIELDRSNRYEQPLTLLLLDLDDFKAFNDAYGHVEGDQVLRRLGQVVKRCLRETDFAFRYGGEEFTILLPMTTSADGAVMTERIRTEFKKELFSPAPGQDVHVTLSIGLAQYKPQEDIKAFVHRVDQLMYQAKKNGKDRVCSES